MAEPAAAPFAEEFVAELERRRNNFTVRLFNVYHVYRVVVGFALLFVSVQTGFATELGQLNRGAFVLAAGLYTAANLVIALLGRFSGWLTSEHIAAPLVLADLICLSVLMYFSAGLGSGLAALILVTVAAGAILIEGRMATAIAAAASLIIIYEEFYLGLSVPSSNVDYFQAGLFGVIYFATSLTIQRLSARLRENDLLALTREAEVADLERLNRQIIQRMRTGILVVDDNNRVRMHNRSARLLIGLDAHEPLDQLPKGLSDRLDQWRNDITLRTAPLKLADHAPQIRVNFSAVRIANAQGDVTIFLEDTSEVQQQAQQLKLAELGRLSASIAHEVRNPLGAISHAAQLLKESDDMAEHDSRLVDIIVNHCERMNGVVENVLEMSRRKQPSPQRLNLQACVEEFISDSQQMFKDADIEWKVEPKDTTVRIDPAQLHQVLTNLVDNALRYSEKNGRGRSARIVGGLEPSSDRPYLNVIDYGTGVDPELIPDLFQPFKTNSLGGTGLGLYISKEMCDANQAQLSYLPTDDGSCFRILFPHPDRITL